MEAALIEILNHGFDTLDGLLFLTTVSDFSKYNQGIDHCFQEWVNENGVRKYPTAVHSKAAKTASLLKMISVIYINYLLR